MKSFLAESKGKVHLLRLDTGDDLLACVNALIAERGIENAVVVSGIGTFDRCVLHMVTTTGFPAVEHFARWEDKALELASVDGIVAGGVPHLHAVVSDTQSTWAGHVEPGCRILYLGELALLEIDAPGLRRIANARGINELTQ